MWFLVSNMEIQKPSQELHFEVTKKHTCLLFHIHVFNLFKSWWNQGFDQDSNGYNILINKIYTYSNQEIMYLTPNPKLCLMKVSMHEEKWFLVSSMEISKPPPPRASFWSD